MHDDSDGKPSHASERQEPTLEQTVTQIRALLRSGNEAHAKALFGTLTRKLLPLIERRAQIQLGRYRRELVAEGIQEALLLFWRRLSDEKHLGEPIHLERRFGQAFKLLLSDAFKSVRTERYGLTENRGTLEQLDTESVSAEETPTPNMLDTQPDVSALVAFERPWQDQTMRTLLDTIPDQRWATALMMEVQGYDQEEIAAHFRKTPRMIRHWIKNAKGMLKAHLLATYRTDKHGHPILEEEIL